jgi:glycosyltransferase involved in cell wall biosynthesis
MEQEVLDNSIFSVVIPAYQARGTIRAAVESALANDTPTEVIVVDDWSPDAIQPADLPGGTVRLIRRSSNGGTSLAGKRWCQGCPDLRFPGCEAVDPVELGLFDPCWRIAEHVDVWLRLLRHGHAPPTYQSPRTSLAGACPPRHARRNAPVGLGSPLEQRA